jgi:hypothetical protein
MKKQKNKTPKTNKSSRRNKLRKKTERFSSMHEFRRRFYPVSSRDMEDAEKREREFGIDLALQSLDRHKADL